MQAGWGETPANSVANQLAIAANSAAIPHSASQTRCGIASSRRKKTVRRLRRSSSRALELYGIFADGQRADGRQRVARGIAVGQQRM